MSRFRVLHVVGPLGYRGTERTVELISTHCDRKSFTTAVLGLGEPGPRGLKAQQEGIEVFCAHGDMAAAQDIIRRFGPHVLHVHSHLSERELGAVTNGYGGRIVETNVFGRPKLALIGRASYHGIVSATAADRWWRWLSARQRQRVHGWGVAYNPVACQAWLPPFADSAAARSALGLPLDERLVGFTITNWHPGVLDAMRCLRSQMRVRFVSVGAPREMIDQVIRKGLERDFTMLPATTDDRLLATFWQAIEIAVHGSIAGESFGLSIAEAMAAGKPVVTLATPYRGNAQTELVDNGVTGFVTYRPRDMASAIATLLGTSELVRSFGREGQRKVRSTYDSQLVAEHWQAIYASLCERGDLASSVRRSMADVRGLSGYSLRRMMQCYGVPSPLAVVGGVAANDSVIHEIGRRVKVFVQRARHLVRSS